MKRIKLERAIAKGKLRLIIGFSNEAEARQFMENSELQFGHYLNGQEHFYVTLIDNIDNPE